MQDARQQYWTLLRRELAWPFRAPSDPRKRPAPFWRAPLDKIGDAGDVPLHAYCAAVKAPAWVRDGLAMLAIVALAPELRSTGNPRVPSSPALPIESLVSWAGTSTDERNAMCPWFESTGPLETHGLIRRDRDEVTATPQLLELVAGRTWPAPTTPGMAIVETTGNAHVGIVDDFEISKLVATIGASRAAVPVVHLVGSRGSGRLRIASAISSRVDENALITLPAKYVDDLRFVEAMLCEARACRARVVITNADDVTPICGTAIAALARTARTFVWTTSSRSSRWCASALVYALPSASVTMRRRAWEHEAQRSGVHIEAESLEQLSALEVGRHAISMTTRTAALIYRGPAPYDALAEIAKHFSQGGHDGMRT